MTKDDDEMLSFEDYIYGDIESLIPKSLYQDAIFRTSMSVDYPSVHGAKEGVKVFESLRNGEQTPE